MFLKTTVAEDLSLVSRPIPGSSAPTDSAFQGDSEGSTHGEAGAGTMDVDASRYGDLTR